MSNDPKETKPDAAELLKQLIDAGGIDLIRQVLGAPASGPNPNLPAHPDDIKAAHDKIRGDLEGRHREHVARANRASGHPEPEIGNTFYGWLRKQVRGGTRTREGINFEAGQNVKILVGDPGNPDHVTAAQKANGHLVSVDGMERIFEDDTLVINRDPTAVASADIDSANARAADAEARAAAAEKRASELEAQVAEARRGAQDPGDGRPSRLPAAAKARATGTEPKEPDKG